MKKMIAVCLACLLIVLSVPALAEENPRLIHVSGNATVALAADTATLQIGVNTKKPTVQEAQKENAPKPISVRASGNVTSSRDVFEKAYSPIYAQVSGSSMDLSPVSRKAESPISVIFVSAANVTVSRFLQPANIRPSIFSIFDGMLICFTAVFEKVFAPKFSSCESSGITISLSFEHPSKLSK